MIRVSAISDRRSGPALFESCVAMRKSPSTTLFVISSAARNLRSLTFVRDDKATFGDRDTVFF
jgi:hypothetical protein